MKLGNITPTKAAKTVFALLVLWFVGYGFVYPTTLPLASSERIKVIGGLMGWLVLPRILDLILIPAMAAWSIGCIERIRRQHFQDLWPGAGQIVLNIWPILTCLFGALFGTWAGAIMASSLVVLPLTLVVGTSVAYRGTRGQVLPDIRTALRFVGRKVVGWVNLCLTTGRTWLTAKLEAKTDDGLRSWAKAIVFLGITDAKLQTLVGEGEIRALRQEDGSFEFQLTDLEKLKYELENPKEISRSIDLSFGDGDVCETLTDDLIFDEGDDLDLSADEASSIAT